MINLLEAAYEAIYASLYDKNTHERVTRFELGITSELYDAAIVESLAGPGDGYVAVGPHHRRVYAGLSRRITQ